ncbi:MAG: hypothetical protein ABW076_13365 [Candidatus Thiodiazotropha sp.]
MLIKSKLRAGSILLALIPALLVGGPIGWYAFDHAKTALEDQAPAYANDLMTIDALLGKLADHAIVFHPGFRELLHRIGDYDSILIDADTGELMYSVLKEFDYTTSLKTSTFADSGLAKAQWRQPSGRLPIKTFLLGSSVGLPTMPARSDRVARPKESHVLSCPYLAEGLESMLLPAWSAWHIGQTNGVNSSRQASGDTKAAS